MTHRQTQSNFLARLAQVDFTPPWSAASAALTIVFAVLLIIIGTAAAFAWLGEGGATPLAGWLVGSMLMILLVRQTRVRDREALQLGTSRTPLALVLFIGVGAAITIDVVGLALTGAFVPVPELLGLNRDALNAVDLILATLFLVVAQPLGEELVFRGVALPAIRSALGGWGGLIVTSVAYGVFHWIAYTPSYSPQYGTFAPYWYGLIAPMIAGLVYGIVRISGGSTRAAIAAHAAFGLFAIIKLLVLAN